MAGSQSERLCSMIEDEILTFKLKPGDKLDESRLAEKYGTSRTPVREALRRLSADGLVELRPHKGAIVSRIGIRDLVELYEVLAELEGAAGRLAAKVCAQGDIEAILSAQEECRELASRNDVQGYIQSNDAFHDAIYLASQNRNLIKLTHGVRNRVAPYQWPFFKEGDRLKKSVEDHDVIVKAIKDGLEDESGRLLRAHILQSGGEARRIISLFSKYESQNGLAADPVRAWDASAFESATAK
jgi:DNA-binding GntR family transcriptional regulator